MKNIAMNLTARIIMVLTLVLYPLFAGVALPWAWYDSLGSWGHTSLASWREGWVIYRPDQLRHLWAELRSPLNRPL